MKVIIVGCGKVGKTIVESLVKEHHEVLVIDNDPQIVEEVTNSFDVIGVCGNGTSYVKLAEAGVDNAELFIAVTASDELNMLSCFAAKKLGAKHTVARIRNTDYNEENLDFIKKSLELSMVINPELLTATVLYDIIKLPSATKVESFTTEAFEMIELVIRQDCPIIGSSLIDLRKKLSQKFLVIAIKRNDKVFIPNGSTVIESGDRIGVITSKTDVTKLLKGFGIASKPIRDVMIIGAGKTSYYLAKLLVEGRNLVKIIEKNPQKCIEASSNLPSSVVIINGDGMSQDVVMEEGLSGMGAFVALTGKDEENILMSYYALKQKVEKVITKVNRSELLSVSENLGLDTLVSPKKAVADVLVRYARALENSLGSKIETLYRIMNDEAEVAEFKVLPDCKLIGVSIKDLQIKKNVLIAGIIRGRETFIPGGFDEIKEEDSVIIVSAGESVSDLDEILK